MLSFSFESGSDVGVVTAAGSAVLEISGTPVVVSAAPEEYLNVSTHVTKNYVKINHT